MVKVFLCIASLLVYLYTSLLLLLLLLLTIMITTELIIYGVREPIWQGHGGKAAATECTISELSEPRPAGSRK